jgi:chromosome partitioning protein
VLVCDLATVLVFIHATVLAAALWLSSYDNRKGLKMQVIAVANQKGGCGKSVSSVSLAAALARKGQRVLLIDLDQQAHSTIWLLGADAIEGSGIYAVLADKQPASDNIITAPSGIDVLPANAELAGLELAGWTKIGARRLHRALAELGDRYEYVVIDCPPSLGLAAYNALVAADKIIVPIDCGPESYESTTRLRGTLDHIAAEYDRHPEMAPLLTFLERTRLAQMIVDTAQREFPTTLPPIRKNTALPEAFAARQTIYEHDPSSTGAADYQAVAESVLLWQGKN